MNLSYFHYTTPFFTMSNFLGPTPVLQFYSKHFTMRFWLWYNKTRGGHIMWFDEGIIYQIYPLEFVGAP